MKALAALVAIVLCGALLLQLAVPAGTAAGPAKKRMASVLGPEYVVQREFIEGCADADPFYVEVEALERVKEHAWWDAFRLTYGKAGEDAEKSAYLILVTDGSDTVTYEYIDLDRDGSVDAEGVMSLARGDQSVIGYICGVARKLR
jgi:hypothetical protein